MMMATSAVTVDDGVVSTDDSTGTGDGGGPRADRPRRRSFTVAQKLRYLSEYDQAAETGEGGQFLRREGLYSSHIAEWRKLRDAGVFSDTPASATTTRRPTGQESEIARLRRELEKTQQRLETTEAALDIMGKAHALLESISGSADSQTPRRRR